MDPHFQENKGRRPYHRDAEKALKALYDLFGKRTRARKSALALIHLLAQKNRRIVLYLGAGCSKAVKVLGTHNKYPGYSWKELLEKLFEQLPREEQKRFLKSLKNRSEWKGIRAPTNLDSVAPYFDKLQLAWFLLMGSEDALTDRQRQIERRDKQIASLVQPPLDLDRESTLLEELLTLEFEDIVTTNYDDNIAHFLKKKNKQFIEITESQDMAKSLRGGRENYLFYLHGKAGKSPLVFDRFDYAKLLAERDGILDYVTFLLRDSHAIYVGFGLDDPTFNLVETRLQTLHNAARPESFAFLPETTEAERRAWAGRFLNMIDYGDYSKLPEIFHNINIICSYLDSVDHKVRDVTNPMEDQTESYMDPSLNQYMEGQFTASLENCRSALASTLFWDRTYTPGVGFELPEDLKMVARIFEIRFQLALDHYKLQGQKDEHSELMTMHVEEARKILKAAKERIGKASNQRPETKTKWHALENQLTNLEGRGLYHKEEFVEAKEKFATVLERTPKGGFEIVERDDKDTLIAKFELAESYYYARCAFSRIEYQFRSGSAPRSSEAEDLMRTAEEIIEYRNELKRIGEKSLGETKWKYCQNRIATLSRIARWTAGRHKVGICRDVIPLKNERTEDVYKILSQGIGLLEDTEPSLGSERWPISPRWWAMRNRYLARGHALRWIVAQHISQEHIKKESEDGFFRAHSKIQEAIQEAQGPGLGRQELLNLLEAARLGILEMFGERIRLIQSGLRAHVRPSGLSACLYQLDSAFQKFQYPAGDKAWLENMGYRLASYVVVLAGTLSGAEVELLTNPKLRDFFNKNDTLDRMTECVERSYRALSPQFENRINDFRSTLEEISSELNSMTPTTC